jgi:hypothetical protein
MADMENRNRKVAYVLLGIALPLAGLLLWKKGAFTCCSAQKIDRDSLQEKAVEDSFPASDPPANW